ncbi:MAG TPA: response regulator [Patescibacteria group bacterium]|jgi:CheY-like chemotaxis protein|nr:response regulator [Patescibacteria group bacterium]
MTKIMLVEDDKSLREIYGVRLLAEGYDIVSADNGEEALAVAIKERPSLIIADVMMPKISGFDMLDILRSTTETRSVKVIIMTALSSEGQRQRGIELGADRYLVKSQVGIEDVVHVVHDVLGDTPAAQPAAGAPAPQQARPIVTTPPRLGPQPPLPPATPSPEPTASPVRPIPAPPSGRSRVIQPIANSDANKVDINDLLDRELAREAGIDASNRPAVATTQQEQTIVDNQLNNFGAQSPAPSQPPAQIDPNSTVNTPPPSSIPTPPPRVTPQ